MPPKLIALHGETKLISPRRLDTSSASPQWIMITAGTASLTTGERWHQIGLQWDETWDVQRGKRKKQTIQCADENNINGDFGSGLCKLSWLIAFNQTCKALTDASIHACIFWDIFFYSGLFFPVCLNIFVWSGCNVITLKSVYSPLYFSPPDPLPPTIQFSFFLCVIFRCWMKICTNQLSG